MWLYKDDGAIDFKWTCTENYLPRCSCRKANETADENCSLYSMAVFIAGDGDDDMTSFDNTGSDNNSGYNDTDDMSVSCKLGNVIRTKKYSEYDCEYSIAEVAIIGASKGKNLYYFSIYRQSSCTRYSESYGFWVTELHSENHK